MKIFQYMLNILTITMAALAGNWAGATIRTLITGKRVNSVHFEYTTSGGMSISSYPVITKFYPALFVSYLGKPRWLFAFLGGVLTGGLIDDRYEGYLWELIGDRFFSRGKTGVESSETSQVDNIETESQV
ncbi:MAG: hypothetical protein U9R58_14990 [Chloroflexota bacterium]|nr:hypothetical protein [Chloroflexota bacterium]